MLQLFKKNIKYLKYLEEGFLILWIMIVLKFVEKLDQNIFNTVFMIVAILLAACYYFSAILTKPKIQPGDNPIVVIRPKITFLGLSMLVIGILFRVKSYPGASIMLLVGTMTSLLSLFLHVTVKGDNLYQDPEDEQNEDLIKTLGKQRMIIRLISALFVGVFMISFGNRIQPYSAKTELIKVLTIIDKSISENDAKLVAAWYDISNGVEQEKVLEAYQISQADLVKAEKIAFKGNIPQNKKVSVDESYKTLGSYLQEENVQSILSQEDFEYIKSLRSMVYDAIIDSHIKAIYDLKSIANHTDNQEFINYVNNYYSRELEALQSDYIW